MGKYLLFLLLIAVCTSCLEEAPVERLKGRHWQLVQLTDSIGQISPKGRSRITAAFEDGLIWGFTGCNDYSASYSSGDQRQLHLAGDLRVTEQFFEAGMNQERLFLDQLAQARTFLVRGDTLEIQCGNGLLVFLSAEAGRSRELSQVFRGMLRLGDEVSDFQACGDTLRTYWVEDETAGLEAAYESIATAPYEAVYMEVEALKEARLALGYAEERDGLLKIRKILTIRKLRDAPDCVRAGSTTHPAVFPAFADPAIARMYERYLDLKGALVASDQRMASRSAVEFLAVAAEYSRLQGQALAISQAADLRTQRNMFANLNNDFVELIRRNRPTAGQVFLFAAQGPTAGFWLANEARINNPYDGSREHAALIEAF